jgi:hypothetical protein
MLSFRPLASPPHCAAVILQFAHMHRSLTARSATRLRGVRFLQTWFNQVILECRIQAVEDVVFQLAARRKQDVQVELIADDAR